MNALAGPFTMVYHEIEEIGQLVFLFLSASLMCAALQLGVINSSTTVMPAFIWTDYEAKEREGCRWQKASSNSLGVK